MSECQAKYVTLPKAGSESESVPTERPTKAKPAKTYQFISWLSPKTRIIAVQISPAIGKPTRRRRLMDLISL